ncbi:MULTISPECIES: GNAT family N-acetyltransferase [Thermomonosporaceae]|uniref:GNAT family N-acetyltransferase n=1 Tax=Thermomonosporaceae TaxID=2012 RepID=UPI00255B1B1B|nr:MULTISPECIES: GNAT family N-acetyltransferase [Thermomonosporaceae]MDL4773638.1 GNAT family N-acetyltransferase [Actinomadura xylanilytica]
MTVTHWPLFQLRVRTPRLELRLPTIEELDALAQLSTEGVHDPDQMPFAVPWTDQPPAERARGLMQFHWRQMANWTPQDWNLQLGVFLDDHIVGVQGIIARDFMILREVGTGSWLGQRYQSQGIGTEMRAAALELAFSGLGAESAVTAALSDNTASNTVSRKLGYQPNGMVRTRVRDTLGYEQRFKLDRDRWQQHRTVSVQIGGLELCLPHFGL